MSSPNTRRRSALLNVIHKRNQQSIPVNLNYLIRVFLLDGSAKVLQMFERSTALDVLLSMKSNLDLEDISTYALFRVAGSNIRVISLSEVISEALKDPTETGQDVRLLFKSWILYHHGSYHREVFQDDVHIKQPSTALWLAYMEATFMCMTGKYYLSEEESVLLGTLKMQSESGDFDSSVHNVQNLKIRIATRFPNPVRSKMRALCSSTISNSSLSDDIAQRVLAAYARVSGKTKTEAQIEFLHTLRIYCPFYGSSFFEVHCQYDDDPLNPQSSPPVLTMTAAIGPLAIFLVSQSDQPTIIRHPYSRIMKWLCRAEKHIFTYWVIKKDVTLSQLEEMLQENGDAFDARPYCDCVYLVTSQSLELEHLVASYVKCRKEIAPCLPDAPVELQNPPKSDTTVVKQTSEQLSVDQPGPSSTSAAVTSLPQPTVVKERRASSFGAFLQVLGATSNDTTQAASSPTATSNLVGSGIIDEDSSGAATAYGDDASGIGSSVFQSMFQSSAGSAEGSDQLPSAVQYASSMSELQKIASETNFSDDEDMSDDDDDDDEDGGDTTKKRRSQRGNRDSKKLSTSASNPSSSPSTTGDLSNASSGNGRMNPEKSSGAKKSVNFSSSRGDDSVSRSEEEEAASRDIPVKDASQGAKGVSMIRKSITNTLLSMSFLKNKSNTTSSVSSSSNHSDSDEEAGSDNGCSDEEDD